MNQLSAVIEPKQTLSMSAYKIRGAKNERELEEELKWEGIFHLPERIYQIMWDCAKGPDLEVSRKQNQEILMQHMEDIHPGFALEWFVDLTNKEARLVNQYLTWGLWYKIIPYKEDTITHIENDTFSNHDPRRIR